MSINNNNYPKNTYITMDGQLEDLRLIANPLHFQVKVIKTKKRN